MPGITGLSPTVALSGSTLSPGIAIVGRACTYAGSAYEITVFNPSLPPPSCRTTSTWSLWLFSTVAAKTDLAKTGGTMMPTPVAVMPLTVKSRRVIMSPASLELKFGAGEERVPLVAGALARIEDGGRVRSGHPVEVRGVCSH